MGKELDPKGVLTRSFYKLKEWLGLPKAREAGQSWVDESIWGCLVELQNRAAEYFGDSAKRVGKFAIKEYEIIDGRLKERQGENCRYEKCLRSFRRGLFFYPGLN